MAVKLDVFAVLFFRKQEDCYEDAHESNEVKELEGFFKPDYHYNCGRNRLDAGKHAGFDWADKVDADKVHGESYNCSKDYHCGKCGDA